MRIGIEANALKNQAGTGVLARHLVEELRRRGHEVFEFRHDLSFRGTGPRSRARRWWNGVRQVGWTQLALPLQAARRRVEVLLCPAYTGPILSKAPVVLMVLDLTFLLEPQTGDRLYMEYLRRAVPVLARRARRVLTISRSAAAELARLLPATVGKLDVAYPGPGDATSGGEAEPVALPARFVLMVGTLEPRKNHLRAMQAFARFAGQGGEWQLLIAGDPGWGHEPILSEPARLGLSHAIRFLGHVSGSTLAELYRHASLLFYPSLYEGFGFPLLEAMSRGCPVVTSNRSSMAEIGAGAVALVDPLDVEAMAAALRSVSDDASYRSELITKAKARAADFSWAGFADSVERSLGLATGAQPG